MKTRSALTLAASLCLSVAGWAADSDPSYTPMKVIQSDVAVYPTAARDLGISEGQARVTISIDETGKLTDYLVTEYTFPAFGDAALSAVKRWTYEPARLHGEARPASTELTFDFQSKGIVLVNLNLGTYVEQLHYHLMPGTYGYKACSLKELDRIPTPSKVVRPRYALETAKHQAGTVTVTVQFYIDEQGHVRMPSVSRAADEGNDLLTSAAVTAVSQWEFEPPMSHGRPVLVEARQDFNFKPAN